MFEMAAKCSKCQVKQIHEIYRVCDYLIFAVTLAFCYKVYATSHTYPGSGLQSLQNAE